MNNETEYGANVTSSNASSRDSIAEPRAIRPVVDFPHVDFAIDLLSQRWTMKVVLALYAGHARFNAICRDFGVNPNTLKSRLKDLAEYGLVERTVESELPPRVSYRLTDSGTEFAEIFLHLESWANEVQARPVAPGTSGSLPTQSGVDLVAESRAVVEVDAERD